MPSITPTRTHNARELFRRCCLLGEIVAAPVPGDIVCWRRGAEGSRKGHIGFVSWVDEDSSGFRSIEGNRGSFPSRVREYLHERGEANLIGFVRLP